MKRLLLTALVAVAVITTEAGNDQWPAKNCDHPIPAAATAATAIQILPRTLPAPKVPVVFGKNRGQPPSPPPQQQQRQPYQQQQQPKQQQRPKQHLQQLPKQQQQQPKLETTTQDRSIITSPLKTCPDGQRMNPDRKCGPNYVDPEDEKK